MSVWLDELDRHGAPTADSLLAQHELMDSPAKVRALLLDAGFRDAAPQVLAWSDRPTLTEFVARHATLGAGGRRLALLEDGRRDLFLVDVRRRLDGLPSSAFLDTSEVIVTTASTS